MRKKNQQLRKIRTADFLWIIEDLSGNVPPVNYARNFA